MTTAHFSITISMDQTAMITLCNPTRYVNFNNNGFEMMSDEINCKKCIKTFENDKAFDLAFEKYENQ